MPRKKAQPQMPEPEALAVIPDQAPQTVPPLPQAVIPDPLPQLRTVGYAESQRLRRVVAELSRRSCEALKLYEPLPIIDKFHQDRRDERILRGSNRAGKSLGAAIECARAVTALDPYEKWPKKNGRACLVGLDGLHCGDVMYRYLFRAGAFKIIRDQATGQWRAYRPWTDAARVKQARPAPPLIPQRFIKEIAWEEKKRSIPAKITLTTGWELDFHSSKAAPRQGVQYDLWWIDEEIENESWYKELAARMLDRSGKGYWSATPQIASMMLYELHQRAENGDPNVGEHIALLEDNPHIGQSEKDKLYSRLVSDEERRVRIKGEFALTGFRIYPDYHERIHGYDLEGPLPLDWCRFMIVDPGRQVCAVLFGAVPPPPLDFILLYDELYLTQCDAEKFGAAVAAKADGQVFEGFVIDSHAGRIVEMGSGKNVEEQYSDALKKRGIVARRSGSGFIWGCDDPAAGILAVQRWLRIREDGTPYLRVARGRLPKWEWEIERYHYKRINKLVTDQPEKRNDHLMDDTRYLAMLAPEYRRPPKGKAVSNYAVEALKKKKQMARKRAGQGGAIRLGP